jgi:hypothetical protein
MVRAACGELKQIEERANEIQEDWLLAFVRFVVVSACLQRR